MTNNDLFSQILAVRENPANAKFFSQTASNYLGGANLGFTTGQLQALAATGTVNVLTNGVTYHVTPGGSGGQPFTYTPVAVSTPTSSNTPTPTNTILSSNTSNPTTGRNVTDVLNGGFTQLKSFFSGPSGPIALAAIAGIGLILVLKK